MAGAVTETIGGSEDYTREALQEHDWVSSQVTKKETTSRRGRLFTRSPVSMYSTLKEKSYKVLGFLDLG